MIDLRDQFAMAAMQGFCANEMQIDWHPEKMAEWAYKQADAMIAEREKDSGNVVLTQAEFTQIRAEIIDCKQQIQALLEARQ